MLGAKSEVECPTYHMQSPPVQTSSEREMRRQQMQAPVVWKWNWAPKFLLLHTTVMLSRRIPSLWFVSIPGIELNPNIKRHFPDAPPPPKPIISPNWKSLFLVKKLEGDVTVQTHFRLTRIGVVLRTSRGSQIPIWSIMNFPLPVLNLFQKFFLFYFKYIFATIVFHSIVSKL